MNRWENKVAIVTGSTSGIGAAIAKQLVDAGLQVVGLGRRKNRGEELAQELSCRKGKFYPLVVDVTEEEEVLSTFDWIKEQLGPVHILINSAGVKRPKSFIDGNTEMWKNTFDTNVLVLSMMTKEAVKNMRKNNVNGHIVHINSIAGHTVLNVSNVNVYSASKYAVTALTETLRQELNTIGSKIKITSISPGFVKTEMIDPKYSSDYEIIKHFPALSTDDVVDAIFYILSTPPHVQVHELILTSIQ